MLQIKTIRTEVDTYSSNSHEKKVNDAIVDLAENGFSINSIEHLLSAGYGGQHRMQSASLITIITYKRG